MEICIKIHNRELVSFISSWKPFIITYLTEIVIIQFKPYDTSNKVLCIFLYEMLCKMCNIIERTALFFVTTIYLKHCSIPKFILLFYSPYKSFMFYLQLFWWIKDKNTPKGHLCRINFHFLYLCNRNQCTI